METIHSRSECPQSAYLHGFSARPTTVAVVGLGKIGLPLAVQYAQHDRQVIGCDINTSVVEKINSGQSHVQEEPELAKEVTSAVQRGLLWATIDTTEAVKQAGVVVVIVPVIIDEEHEVSFQVIDAATKAIGAGLQPGTLVIYETTVPVGTTARRFGPMLEQAANLKAGQDFYLAYSPERVSSGHIFRDLRIYPKVVGGIDEESKAAAAAFYRSVLDADILTMASTDEAEFVKLIETTYRDVNIALANEYACFADTHGLDVVTAIAAANTQPYSHIHLPGVGVGGHCIPVYPYFLLAGVQGTMKSIEQDRDIAPTRSPGRNKLGPYGLSPGTAIPQMEIDSPIAPGTGLQALMLPRMARRVNDAMAEYAVQRVEAILGSLTGQSVLILGVSYRGNVRETAFTSAKLLQRALQDRGATAYVDDPLFTAAELRAAGYTPLPEGFESEIRAIVLQADHTSYAALDFGRFPNCRVVMDGRGALGREYIESLGIDYIAIGDGKQEKSLAAPDISRGGRPRSLVER